MAGYLSFVTTGTSSPVVRLSRLSARWIWFGAALLLGLIGSIVVIPVSEQTDPEVSEISRDFRVPASYAGPVWFSLSEPPSYPLRVSIVWGTWSTELDIHRGDPLDLWMLKLGKDEAPPFTIRVSPPVKIDAGVGSVPSGAVEVSSQWFQTPTSSTP
jgi:hypothetical protein